MAQANKQEHLKQVVLNIVKNSDDMLGEFKIRIQNKHLIILLGNAGSGKTTLVRYITHTPLAAIQSENVFTIEQIGGEVMAAPIAHGSLAQIELPNVVQMDSRDDTIIVDVPGFDGTQGVQQEIINSLYINQIKHSKTVRFVLVSDINDIANDDISPFLNFMETIHDINPKFIKLQEAVSIIFTKVYRNYERSDIMDLLQKKILNADCLKYQKDLIKHFVNRKGLIGVFKMPTESGPLRKEININVNGAIFGCNSIHLNEDCIDFGISKKGYVALSNMYSKSVDFVINVQNRIERRTRDSFARFTNVSINVPHIQQLRSLEKILKRFLNKTIQIKVSTVTQIPRALGRVFISELNEIVAGMKNIGIEFSEYYKKFYSNKINDVRQHLECIACIEKVAVKNVKSNAILNNYYKNVRAFRAIIKIVHYEIHQELFIRDRLAWKIHYIACCANRFDAIDEWCLSAFSLEELENMRENLIMFKEVSDRVRHDISKIPTFKPLFASDMHDALFTYNLLEVKISAIAKHINWYRTARMPYFTGWIEGEYLQKRRAVYEELQNCWHYLTI